jgi:cysteine-rich repeat protein
MKALDRILITVLAGSLGCTDDIITATDDEVGSTTDPGESGEGEDSTTDSTGEDDSTDTGVEGVCGNGIVEFGEACDDGNRAEGDGCTAACTIAPCGFEWVTREPVVESGNFGGSTPMVLTADSLIVAHPIGPAAQTDTRIAWAAQVDGAIQASFDLALTPELDYPQSLALGPEGDVFLGSTNYGAENAQVRRLRPDGETLWVTSDATSVYVGGIAVAPTGEVVYVSSHDVTPQDSDVGIVGLDPDDGSVLWSHSYGGMVAPNGYSLDYGWTIVMDGQGRKFVGVQQYVDWDTSEPVIVAYAPGDAGEPLWITELIDLPGQVVYLRDLALGSDGKLFALFHRVDGTGQFWVAAVDPATGEVDWLLERDDLALPPLVETRVGGIAVVADRVLVAGSWTAALDGEDVAQGFVLGLDLAGELECVGTIDDYDPELKAFEHSWHPHDVEVGGQGEFYLSGFVFPYWNPMLPSELWLAKVR